jgi:hypothetical protein
MGSGRAGDAVSVLRSTRRATDRYPRQRALTRPRVEWQECRALAQEARRRVGA